MLENASFVFKVLSLSNKQVLSIERSGALQDHRSFS
jgi:hypothetical protein